MIPEGEAMIREGEATFFCAETPKRLPQLMRDTAKVLAEINAMYGMPSNAPVHASWLCREASVLEGEK